MAVSEFKVGKKYRVNNFNLITAYDILDCSRVNIKIGKSEIVFKNGVEVMVNGSNVLKFYDSDGYFLLDNDDNGLGLSALSSFEFIADKDTNNSDQSWFNASILVDNTYSQVSIFNENSNQWVDLPCASSYNGIATTVVDSGRNASAEVIASVIASDVAKVELKWNFLTVEQYSLIAQLFEPKYGGNFMVAVRFFDVVKGDFDGDNTLAPNTTTNKCRKMYCGDRKVSFANMKLDDDGRPIGYQGVSLNLIDTHKIYGVD